MTTRPGIWCCRTVGLATRMLPPVHRQRYGMEFIAELYGMTPAQQRRHSARVLSSAWALRSALGAAAPTTVEEAMTSLAPARPLTCRLNLRHRWRWYSTEDGERFQQCERCGKDRSEDVGGGPDVGAASTGTIG